MTARDALFRDIWDMRSTAEKNALIDAHRDEVELEIGRDTLRDGLTRTLLRLVGEENAAKLLDDFRDAYAHELAEQIRDHDNAVGPVGAQAAADLIDPEQPAT